MAISGFYVLISTSMTWKLRGIGGKIRDGAFQVDQILRPWRLKLIPGPFLKPLVVGGIHIEVGSFEFVVLASIGDQ